MKYTTFILSIILTGSVFAQSDSTIFGISRNTQTQEVFLSKLEPSSGELTVLSSSPLASTYVWNSLATIDPFGEIYYFNSMNTLLGVSTATGDVVSSASIEPDDVGYFDFMQFNTADSSLYGLRREGGFPTTFTLVRVDHVSGTLTDVGTSSFTTLLSVTPLSVIDPMNNIFYVQSLTALIGLDMLTGEVVLETALDSEPNTYIDFMRINYADSLIYGVRRHSQTTGSFLCRINPNTGAITPLSDEPFFQGLTIGNTMATIDPNNRIFYLSGLPPTPTYEVHLYGLDLETGEIVVDNIIDLDTDGYFDMMCYYPDKGPVPAFILNSDQAAAPNPLKVYPNPTSTSFTIAHTQYGTYEVYNLLGAKLLEGDLKPDQTRVDVSLLDAGVYLVVTQAETGVSNEKLLIK